jgi:hypothetical protein
LKTPYFGKNEKIGLKQGEFEIHILHLPIKKQTAMFKTNHFLFFVITFFVMTSAPKLFASPPSYVPKYYRSVGIKFGPRWLNTDPGTINTMFADDSPATDFFNSSYDVKDNYFGLGIQLDYSWRRYNGLSHSIFVDLNVGENFGGLFEYSIGWSFTRDVGRFLSIRPNIGLGFGNYGFKIGQIENRTGYIQVNETIFDDDFVDITLVSQVFLISPQLDVRYGLTENIFVTGQLSFDISSADSNAELRFKSPSGDGEATRKIEGDNPKVTLNDKKLTSLPYNAGGLRVSFGISYSWNRD